MKWVKRLALFLILAFSNLTLSEFSTPPSLALILGLVVFPGALLALQAAHRVIAVEADHQQIPKTLGFL